MPRLGARWRLALVVVALATVTRLPSLVRAEPLNPDEAFVATEASVLGAGGHLYRDLVDRKPPLVPYLVELTQDATGTTALLPLRLLALAAHIATALLLAAVARRRWDERTAWCAAGLYLCGSVGLRATDAQAISFEAFMLPFTVAAYLCAQQRRNLAAGAASAAAALCKQVGAAVLVPVLALAWRRDRAGGLARATGGFAVVVLAVALAVGWSSFWFWNVTTGWQYADPAGSGAAVADAAVTNTRIFLLGSAPLVLLAGWGWRRWREEADLWLWLAASVLGVAAGFHFFGHYYLQLLPPLALIAAATAGRRTITVRRRIVAVTAALAAVFSISAFSVPAPGQRESEAIAGAVVRMTRPSDRIFVWGHLPQVYWIADRRPATRFLTSGFLTGHSGARNSKRIGPELAVPGAWSDFAADLTAHPPEIIVDILGSSRSRPFPAFTAVLRKDYVRTANVGGAVIYARISGARAHPADETTWRSRLLGAVAPPATPAQVPAREARQRRQQQQR